MELDDFPETDIIQSFKKHVQIRQMLVSELKLYL